MSTATSNWYAEAEAKLEALKAAAADVAWTFDHAPAPDCAEDVERLMAYRRKIGLLTYHTPEPKPERCRPVTDCAAAVAQATGAILRWVDGSERALHALASKGAAGMIGGLALSPKDVFYLDQPAGLQKTWAAVLLRNLPADHGIRALLEPNEHYQVTGGPAVLLGQARQLASLQDQAEYYAAPSWVPLSQVAAWTRQARAEQLRDLEAKRYAAEIERRRIEREIERDATPAPLRIAASEWRRPVERAIELPQSAAKPNR